MVYTTQCLKELLAAGAAQNKEGITALMLVKNSSSLNELIIAGADVNIKDSKGNTSLIYSIHKRNIDHIKVIISAGADVNAENQFITPLMYAAQQGEERCLK